VQKIISCIFWKACGANFRNSFLRIKYTTVFAFVIFHIIFLFAHIFHYSFSCFLVHEFFIFNFLHFHFHFHFIYLNVLPHLFSVTFLCSLMIIFFLLQNHARIYSFCENKWIMRKRQRRRNWIIKWGKRILLCEWNLHDFILNKKRISLLDEFLKCRFRDKKSEYNFLGIIFTLSISLSTRNSNPQRGFYGNLEDLKTRFKNYA
jgi:hypothetical protein